MKLDKKFIERLATYSFGLAIGLVLVGLIQMGRSRSTPPAGAAATPETETSSNEVSQGSPESELVEPTDP